ncbi:hypothetical protein KKF59_01040 [Patescibacteria group bacterium]|nr:hypothetical protein [Patescibacteria group bacterium]MBU1034455.1 hypothetical protein [Patescibacteria group bacterium]MBU1630007.1 hypothetical protein [Patescibacteria group bacterium]MBU1907700.1 hypothetical protein [Patescibacteria group bacterium]
MKNAKFFAHAATIGLFGVLLFILCMLWKLTITDPLVDQFHVLYLKFLFPGFKGFDVASILWGMVLSFVYGFLAAVVFHGLHPDCCKPKK